MWFARSAPPQALPPKAPIGVTRERRDRPNGGDLDAANKACSLGAQQSPIDIVAPIKSRLPALKLSWGKTADTIVNNGHTIQLNFAEGSTLKLGEILREGIAAAAESASQRASRWPIATGRAAEAEIDPAGVHRFERAELLSDHQRCVVR